MTDTNPDRRLIYTRWFLLRFGLVVFDVLAVNFAYFLALLVRFYVNFEFNVWATKYIPAFFKFTPLYTVICLIVFAACGLYKSLWKYAGLSDMRRIVTSSLITCSIQIVGSIVLVMRMPITYYALGAAFQFALIAISRFSYRLFLIEKGKFAKQRNHASINVMLIGTGEFNRTMVNYLNHDPDSMARPVCIVDFSNREYGGTMADVPVVGGIEAIEDAVKKYKVNRILLADSIMPYKIRKNIREMCKEADIDVQDFSGCFQRAPSRVPMQIMMDYVEGPFEVEIGDEKYIFQDPEEAVKEISGKYILSSVRVQDGKLYIKVMQDILQPNDAEADWIQNYEKETGENVSFF